MAVSGISGNHVKKLNALECAQLLPLVQYIYKSDSSGLLCEWEEILYAAVLRLRQEIYYNDHALLALAVFRLRHQPDVWEKRQDGDGIRIWGNQMYGDNDTTIVLRKAQGLV